MNILSIGLIVLSGIMVAVGDAFLKKAAIPGNFAAAIRTPWFVGAVFLYLLQIGLLLLLFFHKSPLGIVGTALTFVYAIVMVLIGYFFFAERFAVMQVSGIVLGITAVFLMTYKI